MSAPKHLPETFKSLREELGLTQSALARLFGVSSGAVCRWEQPPPLGRVAPPPAYILLEFLGLESKAQRRPSLRKYMDQRAAEL